MNMAFQFLLGSTPIKQTEAAALLAATGEYGDGPISIELTDIFDLRKIDSKRLFELSVQKQDQELASLAWKISIQKASDGKGSFQNKKITKATRNGAHMKVLRDDATPEELIEKLNSHNSYWSAGAALLLLRSSGGDWVTMKEIATDYVNLLWRNTGIRETCVAFRGFARNHKTGGWEPVDLSSDVDRKKTFHVSPVYIGLREGLIWCRNHGLVEQQRGVSVGSAREGVSPQADHMQRMFYKCRASERGQAMVEAWGDIEDYIDRIFATRYN